MITQFQLKPIRVLKGTPKREMLLKRKGKTKGQPKTSIVT